MDNSINLENLQGVLGVMIPIVAIIGGLSLSFGIAYMRNKERMELISRGVDVTSLYKTEISFKGRRRSSLRTGLIAFGIGAGLLIAYIIDTTLLPKGDHPVIYFGFVGVFVGIGLILSHMMEKKEPQGGENTGV